MPHSNEQQPKQANSEQMRQLRELVLGKDCHLVKQSIKTDARELVGEVLSEALHDREKHDGSVSNVLVPLVEKSVEKSVAEHSEKFVGYLYPLVGTLVRKSVTAFITELLEKTNTLIENSLTLQGLTWRFKAWQSGVSFSQFAASQTFAFRVEQVFLIHRETGLLLNSVSLGLESEADADMVSSMLTAINDFVSDSFTTNSDSTQQNLDVVRTDDFTLLLKQGPKAAVAAAITGNMPQRVANQLQSTLEEIHKLYSRELDEFVGDSVPLIDSQHQLSDCLMAELRPEQARTGRPWLAWAIVALIVIGCSFLGVKRWQLYELTEQVGLIDNTPGIVLTYLDSSGFDRVELGVLRDPAAQTVANWLANQEIDTEQVQVEEKAFLSLDPALIKQKLEQMIQRYPDVTLTWIDNQPQFSGKSSNLNKLRLQRQLGTLIGLDYRPNWLDNLITKGAEDNAANDPKLVRAILDLNIAKIDRISIAFGPASSELSEQAIEKLIVLKEQFKDLVGLAEQQELAMGLIIMGTSDTDGAASYNRVLSQKRAEKVKLKLQELGMAASRLNAIGLGAIDLKTSKEGARQVLFNVVYFEGG